MQNNLLTLIDAFQSYLDENHEREESLFGTPILCERQAPSAPQPLPPKALPLPAPHPVATPVVRAEKVETPPAPPPIEKKETKVQENPETMIAQTEPLLATSPSPSLGQWRAILAKVAPKIVLYDQPVSDHNAKKIKEAYKERALAPTVALLVNPSLKRYAPFLRNLALAISSCKAPCRLIDTTQLEGENKWDNFLSAKQMRLVLCPDQLLFTLPHLMTHYKEIPQKRERTLDQIPLLLLPDLSLYAKDPMLKRSLWTLICQTLAI